MNEPFKYERNDRSYAQSFLWATNTLERIYADRHNIARNLELEAEYEEAMERCSLIDEIEKGLKFMGRKISLREVRKIMEMPITMIERYRDMIQTIIKLKQQRP